MKVDGIHYRSIWRHEDGQSVEIIDQTRLPYEFAVLRLTTVDEAAHAIRAMQVRGAPLIGATAAYGVALAMLYDPSDANLTAAAEMLGATRPTAVNLRWALSGMRGLLEPLPAEARAQAAWAHAHGICDEDVDINRKIGQHGVALIHEIADRKPGRRVNVLTHCNAGWLATVDWGTATAPIYMAHDEGVDVHVWVDETRPRNQGTLTAWELSRQGISHRYIADNAGGHLMQHGEVDIVITGTDRVTADGDVANKIGTYLKALAAHDNGIPFYVALPSPTIDWTAKDGLTEIPIEERDAAEVETVTGRTGDGGIATVTVTPLGSHALNPAFDVTPARLVTGFITDHGIASATRGGLRALFPDKGG
jgi:methylthioribose-1-phosphate isomerase